MARACRMRADAVNGDAARGQETCPGFWLRAGQTGRGTVKITAGMDLSLRRTRMCDKIKSRSFQIGRPCFSSGRRWPCRDTQRRIMER